jgi:hypothetical protein
MNLEWDETPAYPTFDYWSDDGRIRAQVYHNGTTWYWQVLTYKDADQGEPVVSTYDDQLLAAYKMGEGTGDTPNECKQFATQWIEVNYGHN